MKFSAVLIFFFLTIIGLHGLHAQGTLSTRQYNEAYKMAEAAKTQLIAGHVHLADSLIRKSIAIYPTLPVFDYAIALGSLPDVFGANLIMDLAAERVRTSPGYKDDPMATLAFVKNKNMQKVATVPYDRERNLFNVLQQTQKVNVILGERKWIVRSMEKMLVPVISSYGADSKYIDIEIDGQRIIKARLAAYLGHFDEALKVVEDIPLSDFFNAKVKAQAIENINLANYYANPNPVNNARAIALLKNVPGSEYAYFAFLASNGYNAEARQIFSRLPESRRSGIATQYHLALMDISEGNFVEAILKLKSVADGYQRLGQETDFNLIINKFMLYKAWGDACTGLKQFDKARDNYKLALFYNSDYKPAKDALTKLEVRLAEASAVDKTPPVFTLSEPLFDRNSKLTTAENTVMIKGQASDISGVRDVSMNGKKVYAQRSGDFWGEVPLVTGPNSIKITVTDMSGNVSTKNFTINRQNSSAPIVSLPLETERSHNYCLLIAAQNYTDTSIPSLDHPIADAIKLKVVLRSLYNFPEDHIISLFNPQTADFRRQLLELNNTIRPEDNLIIFYAGHGIWVEKEKKGYWLMTDADYRNSNTWLPNREVLDMIAKLPARHTLLITDACFSGSVFKSRGLHAGMPTALKEIGNKITRVAITSGNDTEVPDESVFMRYLVKALTNNKEKYLTAQKMFINNIIEAVMTETKTEPRYGTLELAGHIGGDFIFVHGN